MEAMQRSHCIPVDRLFGKRKLPFCAQPKLWLTSSRDRSETGSTIDSVIIQAKLEEAYEDILLLYDCCYSAATTRTGAFQNNNSVTKVIPACGYETMAPGVDQHSFSKALIETLKALSQAHPFSVGELHSRVLARLQTWVPNSAEDVNGISLRNPDGRIAYERQPRRSIQHSLGE